ncbi:hypothetical protein T439DRAFT_358284 [Meredithblackwellia eburnea MCA 4105]
MVVSWLDDYDAGFDSTSSDPYLDALPAFAYAMPIQVLVLGMTVTLLSVLLIHLLFTIRYHLPLSKINYCLQLTAVVVTLAKVVGELHILVTILNKQPLNWPYQFFYIEVELPPDSWGEGGVAAWLFFQALNTLVVHITHIQFLTLLFPSALEMRLILILLGPLALMSSFLAFTDLSSHAAVGDLGDAIRNTANSTLTLLYTLAIFIWGLTLNRSRAWRTDGGTAAFGIIALILGVCGTAINFLEVKEDRMRWLPGVVYCVLLWQSWMGFWWWVGAGMWAGEAEDVSRKEERAKRKEEKKRKRREAAAAAAAAAVAAAANGSGSGSANGTGSARATVVGSITRRRKAAAAAAAATAASRPHDEIELADMAGRRPPPPLGDHQPSATTNQNQNQTTRPHVSDGSVSSGSTPPPVPHMLDPLYRLFQPFLVRLRMAHDEAVVDSAALPPGLPDDVRRGWGIRALMMRGKRERGERRAQAGRGAGGGGEVGASERRAGFRGDGGERLEDDDDVVVVGGDGGGSGRSGERGRGPIGQEEWEDDASEDEGIEELERMEEEERERERRRRREQQESAPRVRPEILEHEIGREAPDWRGRGMDIATSWTWRGVIGRWRLRDVQHY